MKLKNLFAAAALAASATLSHAIPVTLSPTGSNLLGALITPTSQDGFIVDTFEFAALPNAGTLFLNFFGLIDPVQFLIVAVETSNSSEGMGFPGGAGPVTFQTGIAANTPFKVVLTAASLKLDSTTSKPLGPVTYGASFVVATVPEPETYALLMAGLVGVGAAARRQRRAAAAV